jgi:hypothetical protein
MRLQTVAIAGQCSVILDSRGAVMILLTSARLAQVDGAMLRGRRRLVAASACLFTSLLHRAFVNVAATCLMLQLLLLLLVCNVISSATECTAR